MLAVRRPKFGALQENVITFIILQNILQAVI